MDEEKEKKQRELEDRAKAFMTEYRALTIKYGLDLSVTNEFIVIEKPVIQKKDEPNTNN